MAVAAYYAWVRDGRPLEPARPIRELVGKMRVAYPAAAEVNLFSWYADDAHYQADFPEDHTPYSFTPWPISPNPYPFVFATDIMHRPDLGVDCAVLVPYWLAEARAARMPWLKYLIWQATLYHVRNGWRPVANSGHHDHTHLSTRTDHKDTSLGSWSPVPGAIEEEHDMPVILNCKENGGYYSYPVPKWFRSVPAAKAAATAYGVPIIEVATLAQVRASFGFIPGDAAAVAAGQADVLADGHGNVVPTAGGAAPASGPVDLTPAAVAAVADATADEIAADPERDGAGT